MKKSMRSTNGHIIQSSRSLCMELRIFGNKKSTGWELKKRKKLSNKQKKKKTDNWLFFLESKDMMQLVSNLIYGSNLIASRSIFTRKNKTK